MMLIIGLASIVLPVDAILTGKLRYAGGFTITQAQEPFMFWILVAIMWFFSALIIFGAVAKWRNNA